MHHLFSQAALLLILSRITMPLFGRGHCVSTNTLYYFISFVIIRIDVPLNS